VGLYGRLVEYRRSFTQLVPHSPKFGGEGLSGGKPNNSRTSPISINGCNMVQFQPSTNGRFIVGFTT